MTDDLDKEPAIVAALDRLRCRLGAGAFVLTDHWQSDRCAVGIGNPADPRVLVYLTCHGEPPERFGYELELPPPPGSESVYEVAGVGSGLTFEELAAVVARHLSPRGPEPRNGSSR